MSLGSSPRVRGTPAAGTWRRGWPRFIPACAGNSPHLARPDPRPPVHPRVCGELVADVFRRRHNEGSSPRVRGTHDPLQGARAQHRFIPACAGNSRCARSPCRRRPVHPRVCGELLPVTHGTGRGNGSSPRVRGTRAPCGGEGLGHRFIPACAGNSHVVEQLPSERPVHPRVCGELHRWHVGLADSTGSSPRVRGTRRLNHVCRRPRRFIPACAGNSA